MMQLSLTSKEYRVVFPVLTVLMVCAAALLFFVPQSAAQQVTTQLSPKAFSTQQPARLTITIEGRQKADITLPDVDGLIFHERGKSSQFQMINGETSSSVTYTYLVQGVTPGNYTIPPISVTTKDGTHNTEPIRCSVSGTPSAPSGQKHNALPAPEKLSGEQDDTIAFLKVVPEKNKAYLGELIPTTIEAYFYRGNKINLNSLPVLKSDGFLIDTLSNEPEQREVMLNEKPYVILTWQTALTAIKEGTHEISMEMDATMLVRSRQQQQLPGFGGGLFQDDFMSDFFARYENRPIRITSPAVSIAVQQVPEQGKPEGFSGAIGRFSLKVSAQPTQIDSGDPINLKMAVTGTGNFDSVSAPLLTENNGIKTYPSSSSMHKDDKTGKVQKTFEQAVVVTDSAITQIPSVVFSFFDPDKEEYQTLFSDPIPLKITTPPPSKSIAATQEEPPVSAEQITEKQSANQPFAALAPIKLAIGPAISKITPVFKQPLYLSTALLLVFAIGTVTAVRLRKQYLLKNPETIRLSKIRKQRRIIMQLFNDAQLLDDTAYLETTQRGLQKFLSLIWQKESASLTTADIERRLGRKSPITQLFVLAEQASYGAADLSAERRENIHNSVKELLQSLS